MLQKYFSDQIDVGSGQTFAAAKVWPDQPLLSFKYFKLALVALFLSTFFFPASAFAATSVNTSITNVVPSGLVGHWTFDGKNMTNATATDSSTSGNNGALTNMTTATSKTIGKLGQALVFDNVNDKVNMGAPSALNITGTLTMSAWINPRSFGGSNRGRIIDKIAGGGSGYTLLIDTVNAANGLTFGVNSAANGDIFYVGNAITLNRWQHVAATLDASNVITLYVNGIVVGTSTRNFPTSGSTNFVIGGRTLDDGRTFDGTIDDVRVYNRAISPKEVQAIYKAGAGVLAATAPTTNQNGTGIASGLAGHWTFDGKNMTNTTATDLSGQGNNGTLSGMTTASAKIVGKLGQALTFDSVNDKVNMGAPSALNITGALTISAWIYPRSFGGGSRGRIVDKSDQTTNGYVLFIDNTNVSNGISFGVNSILTANSELLKVANSISLNKWQHVIATITSGKLATIYVNGVSVGTTTLANFPASASGENFNIGARSSDSVCNFDGHIDEVRTYNRALSATEVQSLYKLGQVATAVSPTTNINGTGIASGLVGHWTFDGKNMTNATATDSSVSGNNGTLTNMTATSSVTIGKLGQGLAFDGVNDYVNVPDSNSLDTTSNLTISVWIKANNWTGSYPTLVKKDGNYILRKDVEPSWGNSGLKLIWFNGSNIDALSVTLPTVGVWHHIVGVVEGGTTRRIYIDGVLQSGTDYLNAVVAPRDLTRPLTMGDQSTGGEAFNGKIDDARIYNRALSATEIKSLYKLGAP